MIRIKVGMIFLKRKIILGDQPGKRFTSRHHRYPPREQEMLSGRTDSETYFDEDGVPDEELEDLDHIKEEIT